jgi:hypothetical protein
VLRAKQPHRISRALSSPASWALPAIVLIVFLFSFVSAGIARAMTESQVKAAFLYNFARYVEWPQGAFESGDAPFRICVLGADEFAPVVAEVVAGKQVDARPVEVSQLSDLEGASRCQVLFVGSWTEMDPAGFFSALVGASVFTVSDVDGFAHDGGVANFFRAQSKVRFEINPRAAQRAGLKISSRLLRLARVVE